MHQKTIRLFGFIDAEIITTLLPPQMNFQRRIQPEMIPQQIIQLQTKLIILHRRGNTQQPSIIEEIFVQLLNVQS